MGTLVGLRQHLHVFVAVEASLVGEPLARPGGEHDLDRFAKALGALCRRYAEHLELARVEAPAGPPVDAPARQHVEERNLLRDAQRVIEGSQGHGRPDAKILGAGSNVGCHHMHRGTHAVAAEVVLGEPHGVVTRPVHHLDAIEGAGVDVFQRNAAISPTEELQDADLHRVRILAETQRGGREAGSVNPCNSTSPTT